MQHASRTKQATEKLFAALNRADELGGELRDYLQDKVARNPRYVRARSAVARLLGRRYESRDQAEQRANHAEAARAAAAAKAPAPKQAAAGQLADPSVKAQVFGKKSCPWTGRAMTVLERHKVDFDFVDLEEPEHEAKQLQLINLTKQHTVPYVFLRGQFVGGYNALAEIERLGQLAYALMTPDERAAVPAHERFEIVPRPNTDEVVPADAVAPEGT